LASLWKWSSDRPIKGTFDHVVSTPREVGASYDHLAHADDVELAPRARSFPTQRPAVELNDGVESAPGMNPEARARDIAVGRENGKRPGAISNNSNLRPAVARRLGELS
jgi:hypothetical protein